MKKTLVFGFALAFSITPLSAFAAVNSINGLTAADQSLVSPNSGATNTMHMDIVQVGADTHRFKWDGTPWRVDQGGTGWTNIAPGHAHLRKWHISACDNNPGQPWRRSPIQRHFPDMGSSVITWH